MVFWGTVLAFVIGIMYYMMHPMEDKINTIYMPASEAYVSSFVAQHQAAKDAAREISVSLTNAAPLTKKQNDDSIWILTGSGGVGERNWLDTFLPPALALVSSSLFQPKGSTESMYSSFGSGGVSQSGGSFDSSNDQNMFTSVLLCLDQPERREVGEIFKLGTLTNCTSTDPTKQPDTKYVLTYGPIPNELDAPYMRNKVLLYEAALAKRTHGSPDCGYLYKDETGYYVHTYQYKTRRIPSQFMAELEKNEYLTTDNGRVGAQSYIKSTTENPNTSGETEYVDMLICISPVNKPYPTDNLLFHYDSLINTGIPKEHDTESTTWTNLAGLSANATVNGGNGWYFRETTNKDGNIVKQPYPDSGKRGLTMDGSRYIQSDKTVADLFPDTASGATISIFAQFKSGAYGVFGSSGCTPTIGKPCITATFNNGTLTVELKGQKDESGATTYSSVSATVHTNKLTQVSYVLNKNAHQIYVDGRPQLQPNGSVSFGTTIGTLSGLSGSNILFGTTGTSSNMQGTIYSILGHTMPLSFQTYSLTPSADVSDSTDIHISNCSGSDCYENKHHINSIPRIMNSNMRRYSPRYKPRKIDYSAIKKGA
ncbi:MAG: hypothetical protein IJO11_05820 [Alphaproteobacteria bacterium]|nr:hypothetical protein [Alphaproteobacteria bacterium]